MAEGALTLLSRQQELIPHHLFQQITAGGDPSYAKTEVFLWGRNESGQCLAGEHSPVCLFEPNLVSAAVVRRRCIAQLVLSDENTVLLSSSGDMLGGGANDEGQLGPGIPQASAISTPKVVELSASNQIVQVGSGQGFSVALTSNRTAISWGANESAQLGHDAEQTYNVVPRMVKSLKCPIVQVATGAQHSLLLASDGRVYALGSNACQQLGMTGDFNRTSPTVIASLIGVPVRFIASGPYHSVAVDAGGSVFTWGRNKYAQCGQGVLASTCMPEQIDTGSFSILSAACGSGHTVLISRSGRMLAFGNNAAGQCGVPSAALTPGAQGGGAEASALRTSNAFLRSDDARSKIGVPTAVGGALQLVAIRQAACGSRHTLVLTTDGDVFAFGDNTSGQLGLGMLTGTRCVRFPEKVMSVSGCGAFTVAAAGETSGLVRVSAGRVVSYPVGAVPFGTMRALDGKTFVHAALAAERVGQASSLRQLFSGIFSCPSTLAGSFLLRMLEPKPSTRGNSQAEMGSSANEQLSLSHGSNLPDSTVQQFGLISTYSSNFAPTSSVGLPHLRIAAKRQEPRPSAWTPSAVATQRKASLRTALTPASDGRATTPDSAFASFMSGSHGRVHCLPWERGSYLADHWRSLSAIQQQNLVRPLPLPAAASGAGANMTPADFFDIDVEGSASRGLQVDTRSDSGMVTAEVKPQASSSLGRLLQLHSFLDIGAVTRAYEIMLRSIPESTDRLLFGVIGKGLQTLEPISQLTCGVGPLRCIMTYLLCPLLQEATSVSAQVYSGLLAVFLAFPDQRQKQLAQWMVSELPFSTLTRSIISPAKSHLAFFLQLALQGHPDQIILSQSIDPKERLAFVGGTASGIQPTKTGALDTGTLSAADGLDMSMHFLAALSDACQKVLASVTPGSNDSFDEDYLAAANYIGPVEHRIAEELGGSRTLLQTAIQEQRDRQQVVPATKEMVESTFHSEELSRIPDALLSRDFQRWRAQGFARDRHNASFASFPFLLAPSCKKRYLQLESSLQMQATMQRSMARSLFVASEAPYLVLNVHRATLIEDAAHSLAKHGPADLRKPLRVHFVGEAGVDAGGLKREFFHLACEELLSGKYGLFVENDNDNTLFFNPAASAMAAEYSLLGTLVGLAVFNGVLLDLNLSRVVYSKLLGHELKLSDLKLVNQQLYSGLVQLLEYPGDDVADIFCIDFTASFDQFGQSETVELIPNGSQISVTAQNRQKYVEAFCDWFLNRSVSVMFSHFRSGFEAVMQGHVLTLCSACDLEQLVTGSKELDMTALRENAVYDGGLSAGSTLVLWLWDILFSWSTVDHKLFLKFVTGTDRAPIGGLSKVTLTVQRNGPDSSSLPSSSTCFNTLLLPDYSSKEKLRDKLRQAIEEGSAGFGLQ